MNSNKIDQIIEYLSLILVLSFFYFHNIKIVILGIILSICELNKDFISKITDQKENKKFTEEEEEATKDNIDNAKSKYLALENQVDKLTLVEAIEEFGFIPSIIDDENTDTA